MKKEKFLTAVQILAPNDAFILQSAQLVREETLPAFPGGAALEFVVALRRRRLHPRAAEAVRPCNPRPAQELSAFSA
jgi:hypothetical protein